MTEEVPAANYGEFTRIYANEFAIVCESSMIRGSSLEASKTHSQSPPYRYSARGVRVTVWGRLDYTFWKFEKGRLTAETQSAQRLRRVLESDLCAPSASFAPLR